MNKIIACLTIGICLLFTQATFAVERYGQKLCQQQGFDCLEIQGYDSWETLFPNPEERDIVMRVNRMNIALQSGMKIAVPKHLERLTIYDVAPFPRYIESQGEKIILVSQKELAWGAYSEEGELVWWGPISSGSGRCSVEGKCSTPPGSYRVIRKQDIDCISTVFPVRANGESGGAEMPYCMHYYRGYALHGSSLVPGYRDSHGCVRLFIEDARWLNEEFIELPGAGGLKGTIVIVDSA